MTSEDIAERWTAESECDEVPSGWFFTDDIFSTKLVRWEVGETPHAVENLYLAGKSLAEVKMALAMRGISYIYITSADANTATRFTADEFCSKILSKKCDKDGRLQKHIYDA